MEDLGKRLTEAKKRKADTEKTCHEYHVHLQHLQEVDRDLTLCMRKIEMCNDLIKRNGDLQHEQREEEINASHLRQDIESNERLILSLNRELEALEERMVKLEEEKQVRYIAYEEKCSELQDALQAAAEESKAVDAKTNKLRQEMQKIKEITAKTKKEGAEWMSIVKQEVMRMQTEIESYVADMNMVMEQLDGNQRIQGAKHKPSRRN